MSEENVEIVRRCYEFWGNRDESLIVELLYPDVVYDLSGNVFNPASMSVTTASGAWSNRSMRCGRAFALIPRSSSTAANTWSAWLG
jgi:ketosteroid isomerase-like protein